ncbi:beta-1,6-N-acetylglucosaminyltransferase [Sphingobacterium corticis]|uniref:Peptide O-xylosyltransferase n=1 Tax=Sphingobacterium corticis TaxID=1812823 RepID=A0ABW5NIC2_9SPHI
MMKHAYLILAHNQFEVLEFLVTALDDTRNDIYIHFDAKVKTLPKVHVNKAGLYILEDRTDVRWGDISVVEAELKLFEKAQQIQNYSYYHLLSGVDIPLKSQDYIHQFFAKHRGKEFIGYSKGDSSDHIERKVRRYHAFPRDFRPSNSAGNLIKKSIRFAALRLQFLLGIKRNQNINFKKGTQWISLTNSFVSYLLSQKIDILKIYKNTFCADEIVVQTVCWNSKFREAIFNTDDEALGSQRMIRWINNQIYDWELEDLNILQSSNLLFARKFNNRDTQLLEQLTNHISN